MTSVLGGVTDVLSVPRLRLYLGAQAVGMSGTWMAVVAQSWLVLQLTGSGSALGLVTAAQFLPVLLLAPLGGVVADRFDRRRVLTWTQGLGGLLALVLGLLVLSGAVRLWMVVVLAVGLGVVSAVDNPARQALVPDLSGPDRLVGAVTLNSVVVNLARLVGPALAAGLIATTSLGVCFLLNALSYLALPLALRWIGALPASSAKRSPGQVRAGFSYAWRSPTVRTPLLVMALLGTLVYEFQVSLPLLARFALEGDASTYGLLTAAMGGGAVVGGVLSTGRLRPGNRSVAVAAAALGVAVALVALAPSLPYALAALAVLGWASVSFLSVANSTLQLAADPSMRGRVMALWTVAFLGSTPLGAPLVGWVGEAFGPRQALLVGSGAAFLGALVALRGARAERPAPPPVPVPSQCRSAPAALRA